MIAIPGAGSHTTSGGASVLTAKIAVVSVAVAPQESRPMPIDPKSLAYLIDSLNWYSLNQSLRRIRGHPGGIK